MLLAVKTVKSDCYVSIRLLFTSQKSVGLLLVKLSIARFVDVVNKSFVNCK